MAPAQGWRKLRILIEGGINDVGVFQIIDPKVEAAHIRHQVRRYCHDDLLVVLELIRERFPRAETYVLGYYQILADDAGGAEVDALLVSQGVINRLSPEHQNTLDRAQENCRVFKEESDRQMSLACEAARSGSGGSFTFVASGFADDEGLFGKRSLLFAPWSRDPMSMKRAGHCHRAIRDRRTGFHCYVAATGHPDQQGAKRYAEQMIRKLR